MAWCYSNTACCLLHAAHPLHTRCALTLHVRTDTEGQEYQAHLDYIPQQAEAMSGPRVFTFFLYLNDVPLGRGGSTWFPHARSDSNDGGGGGGGDRRQTITNPELSAFYKEYNAQKVARAESASSARAHGRGGGGMHELCCSRPLFPAHEQFRDVGACEQLQNHATKQT